MVDGTNGGDVTGRGSEEGRHLHFGGKVTVYFFSFDFFPPLVEMTEEYKTVRRVNGLGSGTGWKGRLGVDSAGLNTCVWPTSSWKEYVVRDGVGVDWTMKGRGNEAMGQGLPRGYWGDGHRS